MRCYLCSRSLADGRAATHAACDAEYARRFDARLCVCCAGRGPLGSNHKCVRCIKSGPPWKWRGYPEGGA